jgi:hypothetical protein
MPTIEHIINQSFLNPHFDYIPFLSVKTYCKTTFYIPIVTKKHLYMSPKNIYIRFGNKGHCFIENKSPCTLCDI